MIVNPNGASGSSRLGTILYLFFFAAAGVVVMTAIGQGGSASLQADARRIAKDAHVKIAPWVFEHTAKGQNAEFFVVLAEQADLSGALALATKAEKGRYVYDALRSKSETT